MNDAAPGAANAEGRQVGIVNVSIPCWGPREIAIVLATIVQLRHVGGFAGRSFFVLTEVVSARFFELPSQFHHLGVVPQSVAAGTEGGR